MSAKSYVLLVDDNPTDVDMTVTLMRRPSVQNDIVVSFDGVDALDFLHRRGDHVARPRGNPSLIILDLKMPRLGGLEVLRDIKSEKSLRMLPVVIFTSSRETHDIRSAYELGANGFVVKPVDFRKFQDAIEKIKGYWFELNEASPPESEAELK